MLITFQSSTSHYALFLSHLIVGKATDNNGNCESKEHKFTLFIILGAILIGDLYDMAYLTHYH